MTQLLSQLVSIQGQKIHSVKVDESTQIIDVYCHRDRRFKVMTINQTLNITITFTKSFIPTLYCTITWLRYIKCFYMLIYQWDKISRCPTTIYLLSNQRD
ncbi:hypothetical protein EES38_06665 [Vibrio viridaestus]|uniref:Uncharacterized protein n=1 Tax=Vibrio viridaestus TaxID=2487322 RepID=A0A3N9TJC4_9VIBR|nr:hypothetical protein EES38_06665 [Vibrio viridaestus]